MREVGASGLLREGLLEGVTLLLAGAPAASDARSAETGSAGRAVGEQFLALGARVFACSPLDAGGRLDEQAIEAALAEALAAGDRIDVLACDGAGLLEHAAASAGEQALLARGALRACLEASWAVTRAVANACFLSAAGGRIVYLAPPPGAGEHADAARAGLENLARTLSIEWSRHRVCAVTVAPGDSTPAPELGALTAYLASAAGAYFSGCLLDLRGPVGRR